MILRTPSPSSALIVIHTIKDQRFKTAEAVLLQAHRILVALYRAGARRSRKVICPILSRGIYTKFKQRSVGWISAGAYPPYKTISRCRS